MVNLEIAISETTYAESAKTAGSACLARARTQGQFKGGVTEPTSDVPDHTVGIAGANFNTTIADDETVSAWDAFAGSLYAADENSSDQDLLQLLLSSVLPADQADSLSGDLLAEFGSLPSILHADSTRLGDCGNIDRETLALLKSLRVVAGRLARAEISNRPVLDNHEALVNYLRVTMAHQRVEQFRVLFLDPGGELITDEVQHRGTIDHTPMYPREVAKRALELDASSIIIAHNHPSNNPAPSAADITMTNQLKQTLKMLGITLSDHVVICRRGHSSFRNLGLL